MFALLIPATKNWKAIMASADNVVPKSFWKPATIIIINSTRIPDGRIVSFQSLILPKDALAPRKTANEIIKPTFNNSAGWNDKSPILYQRQAPSLQSAKGILNLPITAKSMQSI